MHAALTRTLEPAGGPSIMSFTFHQVMLLSCVILCHCHGRVQAEQGRKLMRKRARKRSNYKSHAPGLTHFSGLAHAWLTSFTCKIITTGGRSLWEEPEQANTSHHCTTQGHANGLLVKNPTDQFVMEEWILKVKTSNPALEDASKNCLIIRSISVT